MTTSQFYLLVIAIVGWGLGLGLGIAKAVEQLSAIGKQLDLLPEINEQLKAIHAAVKNTGRNANRP